MAEVYGQPTSHLRMFNVQVLTFCVFNRQNSIPFRSILTMYRIFGMEWGSESKSHDYIERKPKN